MRQIGIRDTVEQMCGALQDANAGRLSNSGRVNLTPSSTTTVITRQGVAKGDVVHLTAETAAGRTAMVAGIYAVATKNTITLTHASNASTTQQIGYTFWAVETER